MLGLGICPEDKAAQAIQVGIGKNGHIRSIDPVAEEGRPIGGHIIEFMKLPGAGGAGCGGGIAIGSIANGRGLESGLPIISPDLGAGHARGGRTVKKKSIAAAIDAQGKK